MCFPPALRGDVSHGASAHFPANGSAPKNVLSKKKREKDKKIAHAGKCIRPDLIILPRQLFVLYGGAVLISAL